MGLLVNMKAAWERELVKDKATGKTKRLIANVALILANAPEWKGSIVWDEFSERVMITNRCPAGDPGPWTDLSDVQSTIWLQRSRYKLDVSTDIVASAIRSVADARSEHPLRKRLNALRWDGVERLETWATVYLGAADTPVHREIGKRWLLGAVCRAFNPGSQVDTALILEGRQGQGKSSAARILSLGFFTDELADVGSKDAAMQLHGAWIVELPELDAIGRAEASRIKAFLTRRTDRYRAPYGRHVAEHPRQCVFIGTVNHGDWLRDETGGRRFLPIEVTCIDTERLKMDVEQLWAEAVVALSNGENVFTSDAELRSKIADHTFERYQADAWHEKVKTYAYLYDHTSVADCLTHLGIDTGKWTQSDQNRVVKILKAEGFRRRKTSVNGKQVWVYYREKGQS